MILDAITPKQPRLLVADLDGTLLHDAEVFEDRFITQRSIDTINRAHDAGMQFAIATARPVSTGLQFAEKLPVDAVIYLNGALIDFDPTHSDFDLLTSGATPADENHLIKIGFSSRRALRSLSVPARSHARPEARHRDERRALHQLRCARVLENSGLPIHRTSTTCPKAWRTKSPSSPNLNSGTSCVR